MRDNSDIRSISPLRVRKARTAVPHRRNLICAIIFKAVYISETQFALQFDLFFSKILVVLCFNFKKCRDNATFYFLRADPHTLTPVD